MQNEAFKILIPKIKNNFASQKCQICILPTIVFTLQYMYLDMLKYFSLSHKTKSVNTRQNYKLKIQSVENETELHHVQNKAAEKYSQCKTEIIISRTM